MCTILLPLILLMHDPEIDENHPDWQSAAGLPYPHGWSSLLLLRSHPADAAELTLCGGAPQDFV
jgi:hypothetical protein